MSYIEKCPKLIPIGKQKFAYQCENMNFGTQGERKFFITAFTPKGGGAEPYPNPEANEILTYELSIERFTQNSIQVEFTAKYRDGSTKVYSTNTSFSLLVNSIFEGGSANLFVHEPTQSRVE